MKDHTDPLANPRYLKERDRLRLAVADVTTAWAQVENALCRLLGAILSDQNMASAILFSPRSLDARILIVDSAFQALLRKLPQSSENALRAEWGRVIKRLNTQKTARNKVAHGSVITQVIEERAHPRLTAPILDTSRFESPPPSAPHKPTGLSAEDLERSTARVNAAERHIGAFTHLVKLRQGRDIREFESQLQKLRVLIRSDETEDSRILPTDE